MNDGSKNQRSNNSKSLMNNLKNEWSLFWDSLSADFTEDSNDPFKTGRVQVLSLEQIRDITKALSKTRRLVNQKIETLTKEIELNSAKLDSLRLVGSSDEETVKRISELSDEGQALSQELARIDERLKLVRQTEESLKRKNQPA